MTTDRFDAQGTEDAAHAAEPSTRLSPARHAGLVGIGGGVVAGFASSLIPLSAIEGFVSAYGIAELLPAAAPPLGNTARLALSTGIGTLTAGALFALLPRRETDEMGYRTSVEAEMSGHDTVGDTISAASATRQSKRFGESKLGGWLRTLRFGKTDGAQGEVRDFSDLQRARMRSADQHPDAPVRPPIFASSDLAETPSRPLPQAITTDLDDAPESRLGFGIRAPDMAVPQMRFAMPKPLAADVADMAADQKAAPEADQHPTDLQDDIAPMELSSVSTNNDETDLTDLSIADLLGRLEHGLERRRMQARNRRDDADQMAQGRATRLRFAPGTVSEPVAPVDGQRRDTGARFSFQREEEASHAVATGDEPTALTQADNPATAPEAWNSQVEYHPPSVSHSDTIDQDHGMDAEPFGGLPGDEMVAGNAAEPIADFASPVDSKSADDDMDAALRDALATLRQLSDRQRNA